MVYRISTHASEQIKERKITSESEVLAVINRKVNQTEALRFFEVKVIIKRLPHTVTLGKSMGDVVIACIDPLRRTVKTVMLQKASQVSRKSNEHKNYIF